MFLALSQHVLYPLLFATGLAAGTVDAIAGGGGLISIPVLLGVGMPPHLALGTNKLQSMCGTAVATYSYYCQGWLQCRDLALGLFCCLVGAILGALASQILSAELLKKIIPVLLVLVLIYTFFSPKLGDHDGAPKISNQVFYPLFGTLLGFYDGFLGPGVGSFWVFGLIYFLGFRLTKATAYTKAFNLTTNVTAMLCFALGGHIDYRIGACMAVGQLLGGRLGAYLAIRNGAAFIRPVFIVMVAVTIATLVYRNYSSVDNINALLIASVIAISMIAVWGLKKVKSLQQVE